MISHDDLAVLLRIAAAGHVAVFEVVSPTPDRPFPIRVERVMQLDGGVLWAVRCSGAVLGRSGRWEHEPIPSSRTATFLSRYRFPTLTAAWTAAEKAHTKAMKAHTKEKR